MTKLLDTIIENDYIGLKQLIKNGVDLNIEIDHEDCENIFFLAIRYKADFDFLKLLIDNKLDLAYLNDQGVGILDEAVITGSLKLVKYLVEEKKLNPCVTNRKSGFTPLMQASSYGYIEMIEYLLSSGANIDDKDSCGLNAKDYSKRLGQKAVVNYFNSL